MLAYGLGFGFFQVLGPFPLKCSQLIEGGAWRAGLCGGWLLAESWCSERAQRGGPAVEFYSKNVLLSAWMVLLRRAGKSVLFRAAWCLRGGCFYGWRTNEVYFVLFNYRFESSSHAISMSAYLREQRRELYSRSGELQGGGEIMYDIWITSSAGASLSCPCCVRVAFATQPV